MHKLQNGSQVTGRPVRKPRVGTRGYFSESNDQGAPSNPGQDWFNDCIDEFTNALEQADIPYDPQRLDHLARAIAEAKANWGADIVSQAEAQAGTATTARKWTAQRVRQAIVAWWDSIPKGTAFNKNFGSTAGTVCPGNDSRLSDAREWLANTVPQAEAEGGESNTPRKWTAQRVHQAFKKFGLGKNLSSLDLISNPNSSFIDGSTEFVFLNFSNETNVSDGVYFGYQIKTVSNNGIRLISNANGAQKIYLQRMLEGSIATPVELVHSEMKATTVDAQAGVSDYFYITPLKLAQSTIAGKGKNWLDLKDSRTSGVVYTNNLGYPICVSIFMSGVAVANSDCHQVRKDSTSNWITVGGKSNVASGGISYIVPAGWQYRCQSADIQNWSELR